MRRIFMHPNPFTKPTAYTDEQLAEKMRQEEEDLKWMFVLEKIFRWIVFALLLLPIIGILWHKIHLW
jgi:hypothetical protein